MQKKLEELTTQELHDIVEQLEYDINNDRVTDMQKLTNIMLALYDEDLITWSYD